jgi:hypothetical protein
MRRDHIGDRILRDAGSCHRLFVVSSVSLLQQTMRSALHLGVMSNSFSLIFHFQHPVSCQELLPLSNSTSLHFTSPTLRSSELVFML